MGEKTPDMNSEITSNNKCKTNGLSNVVGKKEQLCLDLYVPERFDSFLFD